MNSYEKYMIFLSRENAEKFEEIERDLNKNLTSVKTKKCKKRKIPGLDY